MPAPDPAAARGIGDLMASLAAMPMARAPDFRDLLPASLKAQRAADLRTRLAVRGWADPRALFVAADRDEDFEAALNIVADEVETAITLHPGCWYLAVPGRRRVLADRGAAELSDELAIARCDTDRADPVWRAMRAELAVEALPSLAELDDATVRALGLVRSWLGGDHDTPAGRGAIAAELAARERRTDIARLTAHGLIGAAHQAALAALREFAGVPYDSKRQLSATYLHGHGGAGKSTVLALLETALPDLLKPPLLLRLDFDDRRLDPFDPISLDLAVFEQLLGAADAIRLPDLSDKIELLKRLRAARRDTRAETTTVQGKRGSRAESFDPTNSLLDERTAIFERSERDSTVLAALGAAQSRADSPAILLLLDTIEVVTARGAAAIDELARWLQSLVVIMMGSDIRIIIAGRDPPRAGDLLTALVERARCDVEPALFLPELSEVEAAAFLTSSGITDPTVVAAAVAVLPGNPLLLGIAADVLLRDPEMAADVHRAHAQGRIDRETATRFLSQRIVPHVADPGARAYVLPAMYLPVVTLPLLQNVIMPLVDTGFPDDDGEALPAAGSTEARRVLAAFADSRWLTRPSEDLAQLRFHSDLRALVLKLLAADPEAEVRAAVIRAHAIEFHHGRRSAEDRAWAVYHELMGGGSLPPGTDRAALVRVLAPVLDDLPAAAHAALLGEDDGGQEAAGGADTTEAASWDARLEIEGPRFVKRNNAAQALALFREHPWTKPGAPPTFVIQALADTGDWDSSEVDDAAVLAEIEARLPGRLRLELVSRLYWLTRLALMRHDGQLPARHVECLRAACGPLANGIGFSGLPALVAVVEAALWQQSARFDALAPPQWVAGKGPVATTRLALVRALADAGTAAGGATGEPLAGLVRLDNIVVTQTDWLVQIRRHPAIVQIGDDDKLQGYLSGLHGRAFGEVNLFLRDVRMRSPTVVRPQASDCDGNILVMRGLTTEFLRPLAHTLAPWLRAANVNSGLPDALFGVLAAMTIRPQEFVPERFQVMLDLDPESWGAALVGYADRCRLLPRLCEALLMAADTTPERLPCQRVARAFLAWDRLLCGGGTSAWPGR